MRQPISHTLQYRILIVLALFASTILLISMIRNIDLDLLLYGDTFQYWAAGRLLLTGENPYEYDNVNTLRVSNGYSIIVNEDANSMMLYPPWIFPILIPFSIYSYSVGRIIWLFFHILIIFIASRTIWHLYGGPKKLELLTYLVAFTFTPTLYVLGMGHITTLHLLGIVLFLYFITNRVTNWKSEIFAGLSISLLLIKPQLLFLFLLAVFFWSISYKRWWILTGMILFILLNISIPFLINKSILTAYWEAFRTYPLGTWATPTLGTVLRLFWGIDKIWLQLIPAIVGVIWLIFYWNKNREIWNWLSETPLLILIAFTFSPYMWLYDMVVLVLPIIYIFILAFRDRFVKSSVIFIILYGGINFITLAFKRTNFDYLFFWLAPALLLWFLVSESVISRSMEVLDDKFLR